MRQGPDTHSLDECLDITGHASCLDMHIQLCLCYSMPDSSIFPSVVATLTKGLEELTASFPWVAGQVVYEDPSESNSGRRKIKPLGDAPRLIIKDLRNDPSAPTMDGLRKADFPIRMLDEKMVAPIASYSADIKGPKPVFTLQTSIISGGLLLTVAGQHQAMDYPGLGQILQLLSKACHGEPFTDQEIITGNLSRYNLIPFLDASYQPGPELDRRVVLSPPVLEDTTAVDVGPCSWVNVLFEAASLKSLKLIAERDLSTSLGFVSTDDALSAFVWKALVRARIRRLDPNEEATLSRAVNIRHLFDIPDNHPGMVTQCVYDTATLKNLAEESLGVTASRLRSELDHERTNLGWITRACVTMIDRSHDKGILNYMISMRTGIDIMVSSFSKVNAYGVDFNLGLGTPEAVRLPLLGADEGIIYALPKRQDGQVILAMCLRDTDLEAMEQDEQFIQYGKFIR